MSIHTVIQDNSKLNTHYRSKNHMYKSNNWLKLHHEPMRRKPFKKEVKLRLILDEFANIK